MENKPMDKNPIVETIKLILLVIAGAAMAVTAFVITILYALWRPALAAAILYLLWYAVFAV